MPIQLDINRPLKVFTSEQLQTAASLVIEGALAKYRDITIASAVCAGASELMVRLGLGKLEDFYLDEK